MSKRTTGYIQLITKGIYHNRSTNYLFTRQQCICMYLYYYLSSDQLQMDSPLPNLKVHGP